MSTLRTHRRRALSLARRLYGPDVHLTDDRETVRGDTVYRSLPIAISEAPVGEGASTHEALADLEWRLAALARGEPEPLGHVCDFEGRG